MDKTALTTYKIAEYCQVTPRTVVQWISEGKLKAYRTPGNHSRVKRDEFLKFLKKYNMPVPSELMDKRSNGKKRILIVDDDESMVDSIKRFLIKEGKYELDVAYDGFEAGEKFSDFKPDLIILDIKMPEVDGYKLCSKIRNKSNKQKVKILSISGIIEPKEIEKIKKLGADDHLEKPFTNKKLKTKIYDLFGWNKRKEDRDK